MVKRYSILFFCSSNCLVLLSTHFFIQFTQSAMFEKKLNIPAPYISDQFYYYRSDLPTLLSTFSKISQNFRHFPVFYMHTNHMQLSSRRTMKKAFYFLILFCIFHWFGRRVGSKEAERLQTFFGIFSRRFFIEDFFFIEKGGFFDL